MSRRDELDRRYEACVAAARDGRSLADVARELDVKPATLRAWWRYQVARGRAPESDSDAERIARERADDEAELLERRLDRLAYVLRRREDGLRDYQIARELGITKQALSYWLRTTGRSLEPVLRERLARG